MTMHLDAYFSLSEGVKSSSSPIEKILLLMTKFSQILNLLLNYFFFLGERIITI
jgi:hypothetical protein